MRGTLPLIGGTDGESKSFSLAPGRFARSVQFLRVGSSESGWDGCRTKRKGKRTVWSSSCRDGTTCCSHCTSIRPPSDIDISIWRNGESLRVRFSTSATRAVKIVRSTRNQDFPLKRIGGTVGPRLESDLLQPVAMWLRDEGFDVRMEVPILGRRADLVGSRGATVAAIEMKMHRWAEALRQAIAYQLGADRVWVAMPLAAASRAYRQRWTFEAEGVGLLAVDDRGHVRGPIRAAPSPRLLPFVREKLLEKLPIHESPFVAPEGLFASGPGTAFSSGYVLSPVSPNE